MRFLSGRRRGEIENIENHSAKSVRNITLLKTYVRIHENELLFTFSLNTNLIIRYRVLNATAAPE